jgi:hypothetical protein
MIPGDYCDENFCLSINAAWSPENRFLLRGGVGETRENDDWFMGQGNLEVRLVENDENVLVVSPTILSREFWWCRVSARQPRFCLVRPVGRILCCGAKGPKTNDAPSGLIGWDWRRLRSADQLAESVLSFVEGLRQGPPSDKSVHPHGRAAGIGPWAKDVRNLGYSNHAHLVSGVGCIDRLRPRSGFLSTLAHSGEREGWGETVNDVRVRDKQ